MFSNSFESVIIRSQVYFLVDLLLIINAHHCLLSNHIASQDDIFEVQRIKCMVYIELYKVIDSDVYVF